MSLNDGLPKRIDSFGKPLKVEYEFTSTGWYVPGTTFGYYLPSGKNAWEKASVQRNYDFDAGTGTLAFEMPVPGKMAIADQDRCLHGYIEELCKTRHCRRCFGP